MLKHNKSYLFLFIILFLTTASFADSYWESQRKGANIFNENMTSDIWEAAEKANIKLVRLAPDKWHGKDKDFLIGDADHYTGLVPEDLAYLKKVLVEADTRGVKIVLTMLSLPGCRWKQLNHNHDDSRLWRDEHYQQQAIRFWQDLATELRGNPAIVGYNIINEPHPEVMFGYKDFSMLDVKKFSERVSNTTADLNRFYQRVTDAVRIIDAHTPIILDGGMYADPRSFSYLKPVHGDDVLYAFHMYEPYSYTNKKLNNGKYSYPGKLPVSSKQFMDIDKTKLNAIYLQKIYDWQQKYHIPATQIFAEEFGGNRMTKGIQHYFSDLITLFNDQHWHWAFYSFREDTWDGMDYELGAKPLGAEYWAALERGEHPKLDRKSNPIWRVIAKALR